MANYSLVLQTATGKVELDTVLTTPSNRVLLNPVGGAGPTIPFSIVVPSSSWSIPAYSMVIRGTSGKTITVDWGDGGATTDYSMTGYEVAMNHTYATSGTKTCTLTGDTDQLNKLSWFAPNIISLNDIPDNITYIFLQISTINGSINSLSTSLTTLYLYAPDLSTVSGSISTLPASALDLIINSGIANTSITGSISTYAATNLTQLHLTNLNSITGSINDLSTNFPNLIGLTLNNNTGLTGSISNFGNTLDNITIYGQGAFTGSISALPTGLLSYIHTEMNAAITGSIASLPNGLTSLFIGSITTNISGSINSVPSGLIDCVIIGAAGGSNITGTLSGTLPSGLTRFEIVEYGSTLGGGDIANIPAGIQMLQLRGMLCTYSYTASNAWAAPMYSVRIEPGSGYGLTATQVDNLLIDLDTTTWLSSSGQINLKSYNAGRTAASNTAYTDLTTTKNVTVNTN
jgi:hypothetical protein